MAALRANRSPAWPPSRAAHRRSEGCAALMAAGPQCSRGMPAATFLCSTPLDSSQRRAPIGMVQLASWRPGWRRAETRPPCWRRRRRRGMSSLLESPPPIQRGCDSPETPPVAVQHPRSSQASSQRPPTMRRPSLLARFGLLAFQVAATLVFMSSLVVRAVREAKRCPVGALYLPAPAAEWSRAPAGGVRQHAIHTSCPRLSVDPSEPEPTALSPIRCAPGCPPALRG